MAPTKKSKSVNKGFAVNGVRDYSPSKDDKSKQKKRKLSDMLGHQWSQDELEQFYIAYRKYGKDWKKVANFVNSRTADMVEALYNMNRAYLSLPEGMASAAGLTAMMTDHYNVMGGSGSEGDGDEPMVVPRKLQKHAKPKVRHDVPKENSIQRQSNGSIDRCLALLKSRSNGIQPHFPVKKRTPRIPISSLNAHANKKFRGSVMNLNNDGVSHGALLLAEARPAPPSQPLHREVERILPSQISSREKAHSHFPMVGHKHSGTSKDEESPEDSFGSNEGYNRGSVRDSLDLAKCALAEYRRRKKKGKQVEVEPTALRQLHCAPEAGKYAVSGKNGVVGFENAGANHRSPSEHQQKKSKKQFVEVDREACAALHTLAELSLMMPFFSAEPVDDAGWLGTGPHIIADASGHSDAKLGGESAEGEYKKQWRTQVSKVQKADLHSDSSTKLVKNETLADEEVKSADSGPLPTPSQRLETSVRSPDESSNKDHLVAEVEVPIPSTQIQSPSQAVNVTRRKHNRKRDKTLLQKDRTYAADSCPSECSSLPPGGVQHVKEIISHCLSSHDVRRWCVYEWFYSAIDYPWFAKREFVEYLNHVRLGHIPRLTRFEWSVIRNSLGKPRRFSEHFLQEEREKLKQYRESVRTHYANLRAGLGEGLPTDLARPLSVGQQVVAIHPKTRECHNGSVLTVDRHTCLIQFNRPELGVESVMDIDCMPLNPVENMPEVLRRQKIFDCRYSQVPRANGPFLFASEGHLQNLCIPSFSPSISNEVKPTCMSFNARATDNGVIRMPLAPNSQTFIMAQMQTSTAGIRPIPGLTEALNRKPEEQHNIGPRYQPCSSQHVAKSIAHNGTISSQNSMFNCRETPANVVEIVEGSRTKAQKMVDVAIKAVSSMQEGEDAFGRIGEALDATNRAEATNGMVSMTTASRTVRGNFLNPNQVIPCISEPQLANSAFGMKLENGSATSDLQVPSDLIASCVASLLMIQGCTERQYPPAEVAQILDNAVSSLHPCCSQNLSIYREIQMCMGRIKTQILALVPT